VKPMKTRLRIAHGDLVGALFLFGFGTSAFRRARRELSRGRVSGWTLTLMILAFAGSGGAAIGAALAHIWPLPISTTVAVVCGAAVALAGIGVCLAGRLFFTFRRAWGLEVDVLVTRGVYRWTRNPQVLGWFLIYCGAGFLGRSAAALVIAALFMIGCVPWILAEERALDERFGEAYRSYCARTPRFL